MKKVFTTLLLALASAFIFTAHAEFATIDGIEYEYNPSELVAEVRICRTTGDIEIPETITVDGITCTVYRIGPNAFQNITGVTSVVIPNTVTFIWSNAFENCTDLTSVTLSENPALTNIYGATFKNCTALTSITIPANIIHINKDASNSAFAGCTNLTTVTLLSPTMLENGPHNSYNFIETFGNQVEEYIFGDDVTIIGFNAFQNGTGITTLTFGSGLQRIYPYAFDGCTGLTSVTLPDGLLSLGNYAFANCTNLTDINFPESLESIANYGFKNCTGLTSIDILGTETTIDGRTFDGCANLTTVSCNSNAFWGQVFESDYPVSNTFGGQVTTYIIGDSVTAIGKNAFYEMADVTSVTLGDSLKTIGEYAFYKCTGLTEITFPDHLTTIQEVAFRESGLQELELPDALNTLSWSAFEYCADLESVTFGDELTTIGAGAFGHCTSLESVTFGDNLTTIGGSAFYGCSSLETIDLPEGLISIGGNAFDGCNLASVVIPGNVNEIGSSPFGNNPNLIEVTINSSAFLSQAFSPSGNGLSAYFGDQVLEYIIGDEVETIGAYAFQNSPSLVSLTLGSALKTIGEYAFYNCPNLVEFTLPEGLETIGERAFYGSAISSVVIPSSVTSIGSDAFIYNGNLKTVTINSQAVLGADHTDYYSRMQHLFGSQVTHYIVGDEVTSIGAYTFYEHSSMTELTLGSGLKTIGEYAFQDCYSLTELTIPDNVDTIAVGAFQGCFGLTSVDLGKGVKSIKAGAFYGCYNLPSIIIGPAVTELEQAFGSCTNLTTVTINSDSVVNAASLKYKFGEQVTHYILGDSVKAIPANAFYNLSNLTSVTLGKSIKTIGNVAFYNCGKLTAVAVPASVASIGNKAFYDCRQLASLSLSEGLETIGFEAFRNCDNLTTVVLPNSVTSIGSSVFSYCDNLTTFTFGSGVTEIGEMALANCPNLATVYNNATTPQEVSTGTYQLGNYSNWDLYVPCTTHDLYAAAEGWSECKSITEFGCATYTITWLNDDSTLIETTECGQGAIPTHTPVTKEATAQYTYTFVGWTPEPVAATEDATYKAVFDSTLNSYQIAWQYVGGTLIGYTTVPYGEIPTHSDPEKTSAEPRKYTLTFSHWDPTPVAVTGPATYTAIFDTIYTMYTVNFYNYDSTLLQSSQYRYGENAEYTGATPTRPDDANYSYTFGGWDPELTWVWESRDYIAVFDKKINSVALTVKYPDFGVSLNSGRYYAASETQMTVTCANPDAYEFQGADFWLAEEGYHEYYNRILQPDSQYLVRFYMMPKEGFSFVGVENITVNGETPFDIDIKLYDKSMTFSMIFRTGDPLIDEVHVTLNYPKAGDAFHAIVEPEDPGFADLGAVPDTAHYQIVRYRFYTADGGEITDAETFEPGTEYLMMAQVEPYYLCTFPLDGATRIVDFDLMKSITVNGATVAQQWLTSNGNIIFISMPFTTTSTGLESVSGQSVTGKFLRDGVLYIEREGKTYNAQGARVK